MVDLKEDVMADQSPASMYGPPWATAKSNARFEAPTSAYGPPWAFHEELRSIYDELPDDESNNPPPDMSEHLEVRTKFTRYDPLLQLLYGIKDTLAGIDERLKKVEEKLKEGP